VPKIARVARDNERTVLASKEGDGGIDNVGGSRAPAQGSSSLGEWAI